MKRLSVLIMIFFVSACSNSENVQSEADTQEEATSTEAQSDNKLTELEKENEELRKELAEKEKEKAEEKLDNEKREKENTENVDSEEDSSTEEEATKIAVQEFTLEEQQEMNQLFYDWAVERAEIGAMAVTTQYFSHGAAGRGDWYAVTRDGEVQTQNQDNPGFDHFDIHAIGGVAFYQPVTGDFGADENGAAPSTAAGYSQLALPDTDIHKYMLADNGVVYELIGKKENMGFSSGFGEYDDDGTRGQFTPDAPFEVSRDQAAQEEWSRILGMYQK